MVRLQMSPLFANNKLPIDFITHNLNNDGIGNYSGEKNHD